MNTANRSAWSRRMAGVAQNANSNEAKKTKHVFEVTEEQFAETAHEAKWSEKDFGVLTFAVKDAGENFAGHVAFWRHCAAKRRLEIQVLENSDNSVFKGLAIQDKGTLTVEVCENNPVPEFTWDERDLPENVNAEDITSMDDIVRLGIEGKFAFRIAPRFVRFVRERDGKVFGKPLPEKEIKLVEKNGK